MDRATIYNQLCTLEGRPPTPENRSLVYLLHEEAGKVVEQERKALEARGLPK